MGIQNVRLVKGNFDNTLPNVVSELPSLNFAFIDGNHRREPTEQYFQYLFTIISSDSIFISDDIHWSQETEAAWATIKQHPEVGCTIDLFFIGIVLFRKEFSVKQHFIIRF